MKFILFTLVVLFSMRTVAQIPEQLSPLVAGWVFDTTESCTIFDPLSKKGEKFVKFYQNGLVRSNFLPNGQWSFAGDYLTIHNQKERDKRYHLQFKKIGKGEFFTIDSAGFSGQPLLHISTLSGQQNALSTGNQQPCIWSFHAYEDLSNHILDYLQDSILFYFWKNYAGNKVKELETKALSNRELYRDICENPFKFMELSTGRTLSQRMVGVWYSKDSMDNETILLTKNRPKVEFEGLRLLRFYPDDRAMLTHYNYDNEYQISVTDFNWYNDEEHKSLIINGLGRKATVLPNGDVLLTPLSTKAQEEQIADNPEDFLIGTWHRQIPIPNTKTAFYNEVLTLKEDETFSLNNGDSGTYEIMDTSERDMANGNFTIEFTITKRQELNVDLSVQKLVLRTDKTQIRIHLTQKALSIKKPNFSTGIPFTK